VSMLTSAFGSCSVIAFLTASDGSIGACQMFCVSGLA
jgi:hypothetical protein